MDVAAAIADQPGGTHFYCCGPTPLMDAFDEATRSLPPQQVHTERFSGVVVDTEDDTDFEVICARSDKRVRVPKGTSILAALEAEGLSPLCSCREGVCGTCETAVLAGTPDHRDAVLSPEERAANETMMICVSRAQGKELTLDI